MGLVPVSQQHVCGPTISVQKPSVAGEKRRARYTSTGTGNGAGWRGPSRTHGPQLADASLPGMPMLGTPLLNRGCRLDRGGSLVHRQ